MAYTPLYRRDLRTLAEMRAHEAGILARSGRQQGAYYLAGYAVECALKACIAKRTKRFEFPPPREITRNIYTHDLMALLREAGLEKQLEKDMVSNKELAGNWNTVKNWTEDARYTTAGLNGRDLHRAVTGANGVLPWIRQHW
jgi:HEPN domain-containing protein